jgi:hypothetical protein
VVDLIEVRALSHCSYGSASSLRALASR